MFQGSSLLAMDAKGRLTVPTKHRDQLIALCAGRITLTLHPTNKCVVLFTRTNWESFRDTIAQLPVTNSRLQLRVLGNAEDLELDDTGRILVPPTLRTFAGLTREVTIVGQGKHLEFWDVARYMEFIEGPDQDADVLSRLHL